MIKLSIQEWYKMIGRDVLYKNKLHHFAGIGTDGVMTLAKVYKHGICSHIELSVNELEHCKPVLRRLKDITKAERQLFEDLFIRPIWAGYKMNPMSLDHFQIEMCSNKSTSISYLINGSTRTHSCGLAEYDWLESKGFDIRMRIDANLAIDINEVYDAVN